MDNKRIVIIRIHGAPGLKKVVKDTLNMLRLYKKHNCVVVPNSRSIAGMINKINDHVTWGEINEESLTTLLTKRGKIPMKKSLTEDYVKDKLKMSIPEFAEKIMDFEIDLKELPGLKLFFKLHPPRGGFERGGIKKQFAQGGVLGYRKEKINDLIKKMV